MLLFLSPLILLYAIGSWQYGTHPQTGEHIAISAYLRFIEFFEIFGVTSLYLPSLVLVVVLIVWHVLKKDRWELHPGIPALMWLESIVLSLPLLVMDQVLTRLSIRSTNASLSSLSIPLFNSPQAPVIAELPWQTQVVLSVGAGIYEELLFRMVGIAVVHLLLVDVLRIRENIGTVCAVAISAIAFAAYHDLTPGAATSIDWSLAIFYFLSGIYFGSVFVVRGFGIAVGAHAVYDLLVIVILPLLHGSPNAVTSTIGAG